MDARIISRSAPWRQLAGTLLAAMLMGVSISASAALFEDDEARRAILDVRQRVEAQRLAAERAAEARRNFQEASKKITTS
jgi:hypothetical protein